MAGEKVFFLLSQSRRRINQRRIFFLRELYRIADVVLKLKSSAEDGQIIFTKPPLTLPRLGGFLKSLRDWPAARNLQRNVTEEEAMGRTVLPFSQVLEQEYAEWKKFRRALRQEDQEAF